MNVWHILNCLLNQPNFRISFYELLNLLSHFNKSSGKNVPKLLENYGSINAFTLPLGRCYETSSPKCKAIGLERRCVCKRFLADERAPFLNLSISTYCKGILGYITGAWHQLGVVPSSPLKNVFSRFGGVRFRMFWVGGNHVFTKRSHTYDFSCISRDLVVVNFNPTWLDGQAEMNGECCQHGIALLSIHVKPHMLPMSLWSILVLGWYHKPLGCIKWGLFTFWYY